MHAAELTEELSTRRTTRGPAYPGEPARLEANYAGPVLVVTPDSTEAPEPFDADFGAVGLSNLPEAMAAAHAVQAAEDPDADTQRQCEWASALLAAAAGEGSVALVSSIRQHYRGPDGRGDHEAVWEAYVYSPDGRKGFARHADLGEATRAAVLSWRGETERTT